MHLRVITPPVNELVSLETIKEHLRIDLTEEHALLQSYLAAAVEQAEGLTRRAFLTQTLLYSVDAWPSSGVLKLPRPPLQSVDSVIYFDVDGNEHLWTDYRVNTRSEPGAIYFNNTPSEELDPSGGAIEIQYIAGYASPAEVPQTITQALLMTIGHWYENRESTTGNNYQVFEVPNGPREALLNERAEWFR